jgi:hypothetical protein
MLGSRLQRLRHAVNRCGGGRCGLCYGHPMAVVHLWYEPAPDGSGPRSTGQYYLDEELENRLTEDLRCQRCGTRAVKQVILTDIAGIDPPPTGRRLAAELCRTLEQ